MGSRTFVTCTRGSHSVVPPKPVKLRKGVRGPSRVTPETSQFRLMPTEDICRPGHLPPGHLHPGHLPPGHLLPGHLPLRICATPDICHLDTCHPNICHSDTCNPDICHPGRLPLGISAARALATRDSCAADYHQPANYQLRYLPPKFFTTLTCFREPNYI